MDSLEFYRKRGEFFRPKLEMWKNYVDVSAEDFIAEKARPGQKTIEDVVDAYIADLAKTHSDLPSALRQTMIDVVFALTDYALCSECGSPVGTDVVIWVYDDVPYCERCFDRSFTECGRRPAR